MSIQNKLFLKKITMYFFSYKYQFWLQKTSLIVGGLTQSKKAMKILQEDKIDSGLLPRLLFMCLPPVFEELDTMKPVNSKYRMWIRKKNYIKYKINLTSKLQLWRTIITSCSINDKKVKWFLSDAYLADVKRESIVKDIS